MRQRRHAADACLLHVAMSAARGSMRVRRARTMRVKCLMCTRYFALHIPSRAYGDKDFPMARSHHAATNTRCADRKGTRSRKRCERAKQRPRCASRLQSARKCFEACAPISGACEAAVIVAMFIARCVRSAPRVRTCAMMLTTISMRASARMRLHA